MVLLLGVSLPEGNINGLLAASAVGDEKLYEAVDVETCCQVIRQCNLVV